MMKVHIQYVFLFRLYVEIGIFTLAEHLIITLKSVSEV